MVFEPWQLAAMDESGAFGIRQKHIDAVAEEVLRMGITEVSRQDFDSACGTAISTPTTSPKRT